MARRVFTVGLTADVEATGGLRLWQEMPSRDYISCLCRASCVTGLLWREVKRMIRWASSASRGPMQLTEWQVTVLECYLLGNSDAETAKTFDCTKQNVAKARILALDRCRRYKPQIRGLLTVMCETFPWAIIREHLADIAEEWIDRQGG